MSRESKVAVLEIPPSETIHSRLVDAFDNQYPVELKLDEDKSLIVLRKNAYSMLKQLLSSQEFGKALQNDLAMYEQGEVGTVESLDELFPE